MHPSLKVSSNLLTHYRLEDTNHSGISGASALQALYSRHIPTARVERDIPAEALGIAFSSAEIARRTDVGVGD
jgi:hypothetical protein